MDEFTVIEVEHGKWFFHTFQEKDQFRAWRQLPQNRNRVLAQRANDPQVRYAKRQRAFDTDHYLDFDYEW